MSELTDCLLTFDVDWAPDFVIESAAAMLRERELRSTWFVTHEAPALALLRERADLFELALHPNFLPGSTQGGSPEQILANVRAIVPEAVAFRTHAVVQSGPLLQMMMAAGLKVDSSVFLPGVEGIAPFELHLAGRTLVRVPFIWADDYELQLPNPCWDHPTWPAGEGLKVLVFHPIYLHLNLADKAPYEAMKARRVPLSELTESAVEPFVQPGEGAGTFFRRLIDDLAEAGPSHRLSEVAGID